MTMTKKQFYDLAGVPIREIFKILAEEQGKTPDLDEMAARCKEIADELMAQGPEMIHPVVAIARDAKAKGVPVAVASSGVKPTVTGRAAYGGREGRGGGRGASSSLFFRGGALFAALFAFSFILVCVPLFFSPPFQPAPLFPQTRSQSAATPRACFTDRFNSGRYGAGIEACSV